MFALKEAFKKLNFHFFLVGVDYCSRAIRPLCLCLRFAHMAWCPFREHSMPGSWACFAVVGGQQSVHEEPQLLLQKAWVSQNIRQFCVTKQIGAERMELMSSPAASPLPVWKSLKFCGVGSWSASPRMYICQLSVYPVLRGEESRSRRRSCVTSSSCAFPIFSLFWLK